MNKPISGSDTPPLEQQSDPANIEARQIEFLYRNAKVGLAVNVILALLMTWVLWDRVASSTLSVWLVAILAITVIGPAKIVVFHRRPINAAQATAWRTAYLIGSTLTGALWGMSVWWFGPYGDFETPVSLAFALGGLTAGAAVVLGVVRRVYFSYAAVVMLPIIGWFFMQSSSSEHVMGAMLTIYLAAMIITDAIYRRVVLDSITTSKEVAEAKEHAEIANTAKSEFLARMSHEFRTPLYAILGFTQLLSADKKMSEQQHDHVREVSEAGKYLLTLVNEILDFATIEAGEMELNLEVVNCRDLLAECVDLARPIANNFEVSLIFDPAKGDDFSILAERTRIQGVVLNLLSNACKYNRPGGKVEIDYVRMGDRIRTRVRDNGPGLSREQIAMIFEPFNRLGQETSRIEGTGIGLSISKEITEAMDGGLGVDSSPGAGSTFWFELQAAS